VNQKLAKEDLERRIGKEIAEFEITAHNILHATGKGNKITTKALKIRLSYNERQDIFNGLLVCF